MLPDGKTEARVQYVECSDAVFLASKAKSSMVCVTYLKWDALSKKKVSDQKFFVPWNDEISVVAEPKSKWPTVYGFLGGIVKRLETKRDW